MPTYGVTETGFSLKRLSDILSDIKSSLAGVKDPETGESLTPDLWDENDPMVQIINSFSASLAEAWENLQLTYNQGDPLKATGAGLSGLVQLNALERRPGTASQVTLELAGIPGTTIAAGKVVSNMAGNVAYSLPTFTFDQDGKASVTATCTAVGKVTVDALTLVKILTPTSGWRTVTNPLPATSGTDTETDTELRARQQASTETTGRGQIDSLQASIAALPGVAFCRMAQNTSLLQDSRGIPGKTVAPIIIGGDDNDIADVLQKQVAGGLDLYGTTEVERFDASGVSYPMRWTRPAAVPVFVAVSVKVTNANVWPVDGEDKIKEKILSLGILPGTPVYASDLSALSNTVAGCKVLSAYVGLAANPNGASVEIEWDKQAQLTAENISVTVV